MKVALKILTITVTVLLSAALLILGVNYFNRGKKVLTENAEGIFSIVENDTAVADLVTNDGAVISGTQVISMIESLSTNNIDIPILVFTNGRKTVAEYTKTGATSKDNIAITDTAIYRGKTLLQNATVTKTTGNYRVPTDVSYVNPKISYLVTCYYTENLALDFITIIQQNNNPTPTP